MYELNGRMVNTSTLSHSTPICGNKETRTQSSDKRHETFSLVVRGKKSSSPKFSEVREYQSFLSNNRYKVLETTEEENHRPNENVHPKEDSENNNQSSFSVPKILL
uniref:Uncharacterized protein n=1 Tax=Graphocephala atropunctata TaxID=36148 RepID=A0A1B6KBC6_9HEMI